MRRLWLAWLVVLLAGPVDAADTHLSEVVVAFGTVEHVARTLSVITVCDVPALAPQTCRPLLTAANVAIVTTHVAAAIAGLQQVPANWQAVARVNLDRLSAALDDAGRERLGAYLTAVRAIVDSPP